MLVSSLWFSGALSFCYGGRGTELVVAVRNQNIELEINKVAGSSPRKTLEKSFEDGLFMKTT